MLSTLQLELLMRGITLNQPPMLNIVRMELLVRLVRGVTLNQPPMLNNLQLELNSAEL